MNSPQLFDAHCHLDWFADAAGVADVAAELGLGVLACTVTPAGFAAAQDAGLGEKGNVRLAAGLHPWWVEGADVEAAVENARGASCVGEIGLDFGRRHVQTAESQLAAFEAICEAAQEGAVLSIHSVAAAGTVLDVLKRTGALDRCRCVFHWFSGTSDELTRAVRAGCWFSLGERSLATRRGREYARQIPATRLLSETDLPEAEGSTMGAADIVASLERAEAGIAAARKLSDIEARALLAANATALLA